MKTYYLITGGVLSISEMPLNGYTQFEIGSEPEELLEAIEHNKLIAEVQDTKSSLMHLCDTKQGEAERLILGYKATPKQLQRYVDKYEQAKLGLFNDETNDTVITLHKEYLTTLRQMIGVWEYFRSAVDDMIVAGELVKANECTKASKELAANSTLEQIKIILGE